MNGEWKWNEAWDVFCIICILALDFSVAFLITMFFKFHIKICFENKTTIENLERKGVAFVSKYDMG